MTLTDNERTSDVQNDITVQNVFETTVRTDVVNRLLTRHVMEDFKVGSQMQHC